MDTAAYLKKQGWRGTGHSLDHTDRGIVRALQISKKVDALGVGVQKYAAVSDQWWLRAYDQGLKDLGTGKESALATAQKHGVNRGGLYARFTKGEDIPGTIGEQREAQSVVDGRQPNKATITKQCGKSSKDGKSAKKRKSTVMDTERDILVFEESNIKQQIKAYIEEATKRGIIPASTNIPAQVSRSTPPSPHDMEAVLKLAKMHKVKSPQLEEREKLMRNLKRAAFRYLEGQMSTATP